MEIIERGSDRQLKFECNKCETLFRYTNSEIYYEADECFPKMLRYKCIVCPSCGYVNRKTVNA